MAKSKQKNIKRLKRMKAENLRKSAQRKKINKKIRIKERKEIILSIILILVILSIISFLIYIGVKTIISIF